MPKLPSLSDQSPRREARLSPERIFLAIGLASGILTVLLTPPFKGADETAHFRRAYQVSEGTMLAERRGGDVGGFLPPSIRLLRPAEGERVFVDFRNTAVYTPLPYFPHALALALGRAAGMSPVVLLYLARLAGLAASLALVFLAIRLTPIAKHVFLLLALMPMATRQMSLVSADSVTNGASLLLLAMFLRLSLAPARSSLGSSIASLALCSVSVCLTKIAYFPLTLLYTLAPAEKLGGRRRYIAGLLVVVGASATAIAAWFALIPDLYVSQSIAPSADPGRQVAFILEHPLRYAYILLADLYHNGWMYLRHCLGYAGHLPRSFGWLHLAVTILVALVDGRRDAVLGVRAKATICLVFAATYAFVNTLNYLGWNPVGSSTIQFVQGRYYIPIAPLPFLLLSNRRLAGLLPERGLTLLSAGSAAFFSLVAVRYLVLRWHGL
jgi:uncharacterized membrane protein